MKADFLVIGVMKCATSTVCAYLEDHPDVFMVPRCEPNFFSHDENYAKGLDWYAAHFKDRGAAKICGEGSNAYAAGKMYPETVARIAAYNPGLKLIYMARHPIDRILSAWIQMRVDHGDSVPSTPDRAVQEQEDFYVDPSSYWKNISRYRAAFPDSQIFVGFMEDLERDPTAFFARLTRFLDIRENPVIKRGHVNPSAGKAVPRRLYSAVNQLPFIGQLKQLTPAPLKNFIKQKLLSRPASKELDFSPKTRADLVKVFRPDATAFLAQYSKTPDLWTLD